MRHKIKIEEPFADAIIAGDKTFEIRYNDRGYQKGDQIVFRCVAESGLSMQHPINNMLFEISYVLSGWGLKENYCAFSFYCLSNGRK